MLEVEGKEGRYQSVQRTEVDRTLKCVCVCGREIATFSCHVDSS